MKKTPILATHFNPHLDDICGIWLLKRFHPSYKKALVRFISQGTQITNESYIGIGIGRGRYDEHKGDIMESAATLVWKDVRKFTKKSALRSALTELVLWVCGEDHAFFMGTPQHEYCISSVIMAKSSPTNGQKNNLAILKWGMEALDGLLLALIDKQQLIKDWEKRKEFHTKWGKGVALNTSVSSSQIGEYAVRNEFTIFAVVNTNTGYRYIKAIPSLKHVDLTKQYNIVQAREPRADWYLHHSKRMLICGSDVTDHSRLSSISLDELIKLVKI